MENTITAMEVWKKMERQKMLFRKTIMVCSSLSRIEHERIQLNKDLLEHVKQPQPTFLCPAMLSPLGHYLPELQQQMLLRVHGQL
jgi:hypothetical protein